MAFNSALDLTQPLIKDTAQMDWQPSPRAGVWRKRLELIGEPEAGRVTSIVRYAPGSKFHAHAHPEGEEILVLDGVFSDETGDYPMGSYLLNPEGFSHAPFSEMGCVLFVRLRHYPGDRQQISLNTAALNWTPSPMSGVEIKPLYTQPGFPERVQLERWHPGTTLTVPLSSTSEYFILDGSFTDRHGTHPTGTWLRCTTPQTITTSDGCTVYVRHV